MGGSGLLTGGAIESQADFFGSGRRVDVLHAVYTAGDEPQALQMALEVAARCDE